MADAKLERAIDQLLDADTGTGDAASTAELLVSHPHELDALRVIADVASAWRRVQAAPSAARVPPLFRWGDIEAREQVAAGASAQVYRAYERALGIEVALKLHRDGPQAPTAQRFLAEARHLARVRQRNIVGIYGAAVHDGRAGLWCEWIEGRSLADTLREQGAFAPLEAAYVGVELCTALEALHAAGMLHGDLKPANVLRERGGRIVLVDLGAGGAPHAVNAASVDYGTPAYLPAEVLGGAQRKPEHDLYALGRMLQTLLAGAADAALPPTVPAALTRVLARATAADPERRYRTARELRDALGAVLAGIGAADALRRNPRRRRWLAAALLASAVLVAAGTVVTLRSRPAPWRTELQLLRRTDTGVAPLADGAALAPGDRLLLDVHSSLPAHVYVLNEDGAGALHLLFPLRGLVLANPLPADDRVRLPGRQGGRELSWEISGNGQREEFLVVLATAPMAQLDRLADAAVPVDSVERGVGRVRAELPAGIALHGTHLNALLRELAPQLGDAERLRVQAYHFNDTAPAP